MAQDSTILRKNEIPHNFVYNNYQTNDNNLSVNKLYSEKEIIDWSQNPVVTGIPLKGYVTVKEFFDEVRVCFNKYCDYSGKN